MAVSFPDVNTFSKVNNFTSVKFGWDGAVTEAELNELQAIQNYRRNSAISNILSDGFVNKYDFSYLGGVLKVLPDIIVCKGDVFEFTTDLSLFCFSGDSVYLEVGEGVITKNDTIKADGNYTSSTQVGLPNNIFDNRVGVETSRRIQRQIRLTKTNSDSTKTYLNVATIVGATAVDTRLKAELKQLKWDSFKVGSTSINPVNAKDVFEFKSGMGILLTGNAANKTLTIGIEENTFSFEGHSHSKSSISDFAHTHNKVDISDFSHSLSSHTISGLTENHVLCATGASAFSFKALPAAALPTGINANKIGDGLISNTVFGYLYGVTSAIQTQLDAKMSKAVAEPQTFSGVFSFKPASDSASAFSVLSSGGSSVLNVDTSNKRVGIKNSTPTEVLDVFGNIKYSGQLKSTVTDDAPMIVASSVKVANLNAEKVNGIKISVSDTAPESPSVNDIWIVV